MKEWRTQVKVGKFLNRASLCILKKKRLEEENLLGTVFHALRVNKEEEKAQRCALELSFEGPRRQALQEDLRNHESSHRERRRRDAVEAITGACGRRLFMFFQRWAAASRGHEFSRDTLIK